MQGRSYGGGPTDGAAAALDPDKGWIRVARSPIKRLTCVAVAAGLAFSAAGAGSASAHTASDDSGPAVTGAVQRQLAAVRAATAKYHDVDVAIAAGYTPTEECVPGMGYHYVNGGQFGKLDPLAPDALLYEAQKNGRLRLVGVEWFKADADQDLTTDEDRPSLFGKGFDGPMLGHGPGMPIHYDLHAYLWKSNPAGVLETWNATITCP